MMNGSFAYTLVEYDRRNETYKSASNILLPAMITQIDVFSADDTDDIIKKFTKHVLWGLQSLHPLVPLFKVFNCHHSLSDIDPLCVAKVLSFPCDNESDIFVLIGDPILQSERVIVRMRVNKRITSAELFLLSCIAHEFVLNIVIAKQSLLILCEGSQPTIVFHEQKRALVWKYPTGKIYMSGQLTIKCDNTNNILVAFGYRVDLKMMFDPAL